MAAKKKKTKTKRKTTKKNSPLEKLIIPIITIIASFFGFKALEDNKPTKSTTRTKKVEKKVTNNAKKSGKESDISKGETREFKVIKVSDGDTFTAIEIGTGDEVKVRMYSIDAPESKQEYGTQSKEFLSSMILDKDVKLEAVQKDRYGRLVANVYYKNRNINEEMVKTGNAWWYEEYSEKNSPFKEHQENAKKKKLGLFAKKGYIKPSEWRKQRKAVQTN